MKSGVIMKAILDICKMPDKLLILTGFMGVGKSCVGRQLARSMQRRFIDLDAEIVARDGRSINDIFAQDGETFFRVFESGCLKDLVSGGANVLATGGGTVISAENRALMRTNGVIINLFAPFEMIFKRLSGSAHRPLCSGKDAEIRLKKLFAEREQFYSDADIRIDTDGKSVEDIAAEILAALKGFSL